MQFISCPPYQGAMRNYITHPAHLVYPLPENVSTLEGALIEPLCVGMHAANLGGVKLGADYAINGREEDTLARVMELTGGMGAHIVFETAGNRVTAAQTESLTRRGGTIVIVGNVMGDTPMNFYKIAHKELVIKTVHRYRNVFPLAIQAISDGKIDIEKIASDCFDFDNGIAAFEKSLCEKQAVVKAILKME